MNMLVDTAAVGKHLITNQSEGKSSSATRHWTVAALFLALMFAIGNFPLISGRQAPIWDAESFFAPAFTLIADHSRAGRIVLWNPWQSAGSPDYAEPELGNQSPIAVIAGAVFGGTERGFRAYWLLIWLFGGMGMLAVARQLGASAWIGFVTALAFIYCGFYTSHAEHTSSIFSFSFLPWIIWRFDVAVCSRKLRPAAEAGALWGLSALGGYPQLTILSGGFVFLWAIGRWCFALPSGSKTGESPDRRDSLSFKARALAVFLLVGIIVLAPSYVAFFLEGGGGYSDRVGPRPRAESVSSNLIEPAALTTFASPYLTDLKFFNPKLWPHSDISLTNVYLGGLVTVSAFLAMLSGARSKWRWWIFGVAAFFLACAVGSYLPLRGWLYDYVIVTRYFRNPALFRAYTIFCASVLAVLALKDLEEAKEHNPTPIWRNFALVSAALTICAVIAYVYVIRQVSNVGPWLTRANKHLAWAWLGCLAASLVLLFLPRSRKILPALLVILAVADATQTIRLARMTVSSDAHSRITWNRLNAAHNDSLLLTPNGLRREQSPPAWIGGARNNGNVPMKMATFFNYATMRNSFQIDFEQHPVLVDMSIGKDRIWFSPSAIVSTPDDAVYAAFVQRSESLGAPVLVVHPPDEMRNIRYRSQPAAEDAQNVRSVALLPAAQRLPFQVVRYSPNHLDLQISAPSDGWLLVTDRWSRGWRVTVNGTSTPVFGGNFIFRAVKVRAGNNVIDFDYRPAGWPVLLVISWGMLACVFMRPELIFRRVRQGWFQK
jgi:FtsH-binding integral membrane protein